MERHSETKEKGCMMRKKLVTNSKEIKGGTKAKADGTPVELTPKQVATSTRQKLGKRMCIACADSASAAKKAALAATSSPEEIDY